MLNGINDDDAHLREPLQNARLLASWHLQRAPRFWDEHNGMRHQRGHATTRHEPGETEHTIAEGFVKPLRITEIVHQLHVWIHRCSCRKSQGIAPWACSGFAEGMCIKSFGFLAVLRAYVRAALRAAVYVLRTCGLRRQRWLRRQPVWRCKVMFGNGRYEAVVVMSIYPHLERI